MSRYNYDKPATDILLDLIFFNNGIRFDPNDITFGLPAPLDLRPDISTDENTFIPITVNPNWDNRYAGNTGLLYRRANLLEVPPLGSGPIALPDFPFQTTDWLPAINVYYGTQITAADVIERTYNEGDALILQFDPNALCWLGSSLLNQELITVNDLQGFFEYEPA